jgi:hypothetical protein
MTGYATVGELTRNISTEILVAAGLPRTSLLQTLLRPLVWPPARRFASLAAAFEQRVAQEGLTAGVQWVLQRLVDGSKAIGTERIPSSGPLVIASNHPGSYDALVLASHLGRDDLKILVSDVPFLRSLHATSSHFLYTPSDAHKRMAALRESIRHLRAGGALLVFASAQVDPDPAFLPGAQEALKQWSPSLPLFLGQVPETTMLVTIVSGVLAQSCYRHPLTRLRKEQRLKQFLAEFLQIGQQVLFNRRFGLCPVVQFGEPLTAEVLENARDSREVLHAITAQAAKLITDIGALESCTVNGFSN